MSSSRRTLLVAFAVLVAAFVVLHPYLDGAGLCGLGSCTETSQASHATHAAGFSTACLVAMVVASGAAAAISAPSSGRRRIAGGLRPAQAYPSPDAPPPRLPPGR